MNTFIHFIMILTLGWYISGCTVLDPMYNQNGSLDYADCETVDCVVNRVNEMEGECDRFDYMQGYKRPNLVDLRITGRLKIHELNPILAFSTGLFGLSKPIPGYAGGIESCEVWYFGFWPLAHELQHCFGCKENPISINPFKIPFASEYTPAQRYYMKLEGVDDWRNTRYYKNEDSWNHEMCD